MTEWKTSDEFFNYKVSDEGTVVNLGTMRPLRPSVNKQGVRKLTLYDSEGRQFTRSLAVLVAELFVPVDDPNFDTPIHLDGNRDNCSAANLMWRPRWFAIQYHKQFTTDAWKRYYDGQSRIVDMDSNLTYPNIAEVCMEFGFLHQDVMLSVAQARPVFPGRRNFAPLD